MHILPHVGEPAKEPPVIESSGTNQNMLQLCESKSVSKINKGGSENTEDVKEREEHKTQRSHLQVI